MLLSTEVNFIHAHMHTLAHTLKKLIKTSYQIPSMFLILSYSKRSLIGQQPHVFEQNFGAVFYLLFCSFLVVITIKKKAG